MCVRVCVSVCESVYVLLCVVSMCACAVSACLRVCACVIVV